LRSTGPPEEKEEERLATVEVDFRELDDRTLLELIKDPSGSGDFVFAEYRDGKISYVPKRIHGNQVFVPIANATEAFRHITLPSGADDFVSACELFREIFLFLKRTLDLEIFHYVSLACWVMSTWLVDRLETAPYLALVGLPGSGKTTALRVLALLCRRSLLTFDITSAAFYDICNRTSPTMFIDEAATVSNARELSRILRAGSTQGFVSLRKEKTFKSYGAKAVVWPELSNDSALNSRCLVVPMSCTRKKLSTPMDPSVIRWAELLQRKLLSFRLQRFGTISVKELPGENELRPRARELYRSFAAMVDNKEDLCRTILEILKRQDALGEALPTKHAAVLDVLYPAVHSTSLGGGISVSLLTRAVNENLKLRGEAPVLSEKAVGNILTAMHFTHRTRLNVGYVLCCDKQTREQAHSLVQLYPTSVNSAHQVFEQCDLCAARNSPPPNNPAPESGKDRGEAKSNGQ
jgi:hypothetical protein